MKQFLKNNKEGLVILGTILAIIGIVFALIDAWKVFAWIIAILLFHGVLFFIFYEARGGDFFKDIDDIKF